MQITDITTTLYEYPLDRPIGDVNLPDGVATGTDLAVFIETDDPDLTGVSIGLGAAADPIDAFAALLEGRDPRSVRALWNLMVSKSFKAGVAGPAKAAIAAIDCALWDLRAKANGVPLWKELGAAKRSVPAYASGLDTPLSDDELVAFYERMAARGVSAGKLKVGRNPSDDERRLRLLHDALATSGHEPQVIVDANEYWSPKQAIQRIHALEEVFPLAWVEEPVARTDYAGLRQVSASVRAPVATGENLNVPQEYAPLIRGEAVDVVQIGVLISGVTGSLMVADLAAAFDRPVAMSNCPGRHMAHLAAALSHHTTMEVMDMGREAVLVDPPEIADGAVVLGDKPGSGIEFDEAKLEAFATDGASGPTLGTVYGRAPDAGLVGVPESISRESEEPEQ